MSEDRKKSDSEVEEERASLTAQYRAPERVYPYEAVCADCGKVRRTSRKTDRPKRCIECHNEGQRKIMAAMMRQAYLPAESPRRNR